MKILLIVIALVLAGCSAAEKTVFTTSVNVDQTELHALLDAIDAVAENQLPVDEMLLLATSTSMDDEQQERYAILFKGIEEEILFHIWREQVNWVHLYFSSTSGALIGTLEESNAAFARDDDS